MNGVNRTMAAAGQATVSTMRSCSRLANGSVECFLTAFTRMAALCAIRTTASQKGKKPLWGPSGPQRNPSLTASKRTTAPRSIRKDAVAMSAARIRLLEQAALRHQLFVQLLVLLHPLGVLGAAGEGGFQRPLLHVLLEVAGLVHLLEHAHVPLDRLLRHSRRTEDPAQHQVVDVGPERLLHGRDFLPERVGDAGGVEHRQGPDAPGPPVAHALDGVVDGGVDMLADQVDADLAAALERDVGELHAQRLLELDGDDLVLLGGAGAAHLHPVAGAGTLLDHREVFLRGLVGRLGVDPEDELVERDPRDWRQVAPVERHARVQRRGEQVRKRDHDGVRVALLLLDVEEALRARAARLVDGDDRLRRQLVLLRDAADQASHLVGAASERKTASRLLSPHTTKDAICGAASRARLPGPTRAWVPRERGR